jgi:flagellar hook-length control protein FliK
MSVERSSAPATPKSAASGEAGHVKGKAHSAAGSNSTDTGDFSSLLTMLGSDQGGDSLVDQNLAGQALAVQDAPVDPRLLLAQSIQLAPGLPATPISGNEQGMVERAVTEAVLKTAKTDQSRGALAALRSETDATQEGASVLLTKEQDLDKQLALNDMAKDAMKDLTLTHRGAPKSHMPDETAQSGKGRIAAEEHASKLLRAENSLSQSSALPQMTLATGMGEPGLRQTERMKERLALKQIGGSEGGAWGHQALLESGRIQPPAATSGASALSPEMMVAEQVNYWIGREVQNAELKLDGMGDSPIKVNISLSGNEARVEFRTDQVETRQVLEGAVAHLKDLLGSEGLVLSSVSVGTSNAGSADSREGKPPQQSRQIAVAVPETLVLDPVMRPARVSGRTVDLFV